jgi:hypothetical protein
MKFFKAIIVLGILFIFVFAIYKFVKYRSEFKFYSGIKLEPVAFIASDSLGNPQEIICIGDYLILLDTQPVKKKGKIQVYNKRELKFISSSGFSGSGPGEIQTPINLSIIPSDSLKFSIYDLALRRLTIFYLSSNGIIKPIKMVNLKYGLPYSPITDDTLIFSLDFNIDSDNRITVYDMSGNRINTIGKLLPGLRKGVPIQVHQTASQGRLKLTPSGNFLVVTANYSDIIDIYDKKGHLVSRFRGPLNLTPKYSVSLRNGVPVMAIDVEKAIWGYVNIDLTDDYIYARFSGKKFKEHGDGKYVHVYDYNGKFIKSYILDREVYDIAVDQEAKFLYAIQIYPKPLIVVYEIK